MRKLVILPAHNEEKHLENVLQAIKKIYHIDILVIDDCSSDRTSEIAIQEDVFVVKHILQSGYGAALQTGYNYALRNNYDLVIQLDGDGQHEPGYIGVLAEEIENGRADLAIGSRFLGNTRKYHMQVARKIGLKFFQFLIYLLTKKKITDPTSGYQALSKKVIALYAKNDFFPSDFPDADVLVQLLYAGIRIKEIPVVMYENRGGKSIHNGLKPIYYVIKMTLSLYIIRKNKCKINLQCQ